MASKALPSPEVLRQLLRYEPDTGKLFWKERGPEWFSDGKILARVRSAQWNTKYAGREALTGRHNGYCAGVIRQFGWKLYAHRVVWAIYYGTWPENQIDHVNGVRSDNRIENLRDASSSENSRNMARGARNKSGVVGVSKCGDTGKWVASIYIGGGKTKRIGKFLSIEDAASARKAAEAKYGYHPNHGR